MSEENVKSIKLLLDYADEEGVRSEKAMSVKVNIPKLKNKDVGFYSRRLMPQSVKPLSFRQGI